MEPRKEDKRSAGNPDEAASDMICALATSEGSSALAVIRVSGRGSSSAVERMMGLEKGRLLGRRRKTGLISRDGAVVDQVVALGWPEGSSYTGEEMVEIICHGVPEVIATIMDSLIGSGVRKAHPGEFTRRAYISGRMGAWQVLALASLWKTGKATGGLAGDAETICSELLNAAEHMREVLEACIEFHEEHAATDDEQVSQEMQDFLQRAEEFFERAMSLESDMRVLIMGPVNSGKSTLFNRLLKQEKALVSEEPGTTRDGASGYLEVRGRRVLLSDTAGSGGSGIDREAYQKTVDSLDGTEKVIWMSPGCGRNVPRGIKERAGSVIMVESKSDLRDNDAEEGWIRVSCITGEGLERIEQLISSAPGSLSVTGLATRIRNSAEKIREHMIEGDYALASEILGEIENELRELMSRGSNAMISVERALTGMCAGK